MKRNVKINSKFQSLDLVKIIYFALKIFQKDGLIIKNEQLGGFEIQQPKLNYFLESYQKKQSV